jgi:hypothetical protein
MTLTDVELAALLGEVAETITPPEGGPDAIRAALAAAAVTRSASTTEVPAAQVRTARRGGAGLIRDQRVRYGGGGFVAAAAIAAIILGLTSSSPTPPIVYGAPATEAAGAHSSAAFAKSAALPSAVGLNATTGAASSKAAAKSTPSASAGQSIITTGTLVLRVPRTAVAHSLSQLQTIASDLEGYIGGTNVHEQGSGRGGTVTIRVPASQFAALESAAGRLGTIESLTTSDQDVTGQVTDTAAQLTALRDAQSRLESLLGQSASVSSLLAVENQITTVQTEIQQLQGTQRSLAGQIADASLTVRLTVAGSTTSHHGPESGFARAWHDAIGGFLAGVRGVVAASGPILFGLLAFAVLAFLALIPGRRAWGALRRRRL